MKRTFFKTLLGLCLALCAICGIAACASQSGKQYQIRFDTDGGSFVAPVVYTVGNRLRLPSSYKYGYKFEGWCYPDGKSVDASSPKISSPVTLKAKWTLGEYTITFDTDDMMDVDPVTAYYGDPIHLPELPPLSGCAFRGWFRNDLNTQFTADAMPGEDITLFALWDVGMTAGTGTVKVDENGNYYTTMGRTLAAFDRYTMSAGSYSIDIDYSNVKGVNGNNFGIVFALTEPSSSSYWENGIGLSYYYFHIAIDVGAIQLAKVRGDQSLFYESKQIVMLEDNMTGWKEKYLSDDNISTFGVEWNNGTIGCYIDNELQISLTDTSPILFGNKIGIRSVGAGLVFSSDPYLEPIYCARFDTEGRGEIAPRTADRNGCISLPEAPAREGYTFDCWKMKEGEDYVPFDPDVPLTQDIELKAFYEPNSYDIHMHRYLDDPDATDENGTLTLPYGSPVSLPTPQRAGKQFLGWYREDLLTEADQSTMPLGGMDVYAKWSDDFTVRFDADNGSDPYAQFLREGERAEQPANPEKYGHIFERWEENGEPFDFGSGVTKDASLTAVYAKGTFTLTFYALDSEDPAAVYRTVTKQFGETVELQSPQREGMIFAGWYKADLFTKVDVSTMPGEDLALYASYLPADGQGLHSVRGGWSEEGGQYRATEATSVALLDGVSFTSGSINIEFDLASRSPRQGFLFCADIPDGSLDGNWEMAAGVSYYVFNLDVTSGAFGLGKVVGANYVTLDAVYLDGNATSFRNKFLSQGQNATILVTIRLTRQVNGSLVIEFLIDGELQLSYTEASPLKGTGVGVNAYNAGTTFHDFAMVDTSPKE